jgi:hypothetical protein
LPRSHGEATGHLHGEPPTLLLSVLCAKSDAIGETCH